MFAAVHDYVLDSEPEFAAGLGELDAMRLEPEHYRACVYGPDGARSACSSTPTSRRPASGATRPATRTTRLRR